MPPQSDSPASVSVQTAVQRRGAVRHFLPRPVDRAVLEDAFGLAQWAPSNCNTQPWVVYLASGETRNKLEARLKQDGKSFHFTTDIPFLSDSFTPLYEARKKEHGARMYAANDVHRHDREGDRQVLMRNLSFFGAPHVAFYFMPAWGNERQASDVGMYAQTVALTLAAYGIATCPQTVLGFFCDPVREVLGVDADMKLLYGMSIGYADTSHPGWRIEQERAGVREAVTFLD